MPFDRNRKSRDDKSGNKGKKSFRKDYSDRPNTERRDGFREEKKFNNEDRSKNFDTPNPRHTQRGESSGSKRTYGSENTRFDDRKKTSFREDDNNFRKSDRRSSDSNYGRSERDNNFRSSDRKSFDSKSERPERDNNFRRSDRRSFDSKPERPERDNNFRRSDRRSFDSKPERSDRENNFRKSDRRSSDSNFERSERGDRDFKRTDRGSFDSRSDREKNPQVRLRSRKSSSGENSFARESESIRLNRYIANSGICSRRKADELIIAGAITVNDVVVSELGAKVNPAKDQVKYNGQLLKRERMVYVLLNKPKDFITTTEDPQERKTVMELVKNATSERIYPVGRLDRNTTGLLLLTNDGDLAEKLSHPRNNITKIYNVELDKNLTQGDFNKIAFGLELEDGFIKPDAVSYVTGGSKKEIGIQIHSGKNRIVRRIFESLGYEVDKLDRVIYANLTKKDLPRGKWRFLTEHEIIQLKHFIK